MKYTHYIGIDAGRNTGFAVYSMASKAFSRVSTLKIHRAMEEILQLHSQGNVLLVRVEDARKRKFFGHTGREMLQGAGSVKRDCSIWEDFLEDHKIPYELVPPKNNQTKMDADTFVKMTRYSGKTNVHGRDAAMLVYGY
jgi:hypothetical protein